MREKLTEFIGYHFLIRKDEPNLDTLCKEIKEIGLSIHILDIGEVTCLMNMFGFFDDEKKIWPKGVAYLVPENSLIFNKEKALSEVCITKER